MHWENPQVLAQPRIEEREGLPRVARYSARAPVAASRLRYDAERAEVELVADRSDGEPPEVVEPEASWPALRARRRRWAELLRLVFRVDVEVCACCGGEARIIGFVTEPQGVRRMLAHLELRGVDAGAGPWVGAAAVSG